MMHKLPMRDEGVSYCQRHDINYTEAKERSPMDVRASHCCLLLYALLFPLWLCQSAQSSECYLVLISAKICVNTIAGQLEVNVGKYIEEGKENMEGVNPWQLPSRAQYLGLAGPHNLPSSEAEHKQQPQGLVCDERHQDWSLQPLPLIHNL
jgi:hypothetical protein